MDKYSSSGDQLYCYPNSNTLKNKLNIKDIDILAEAEREFSELAISQIEYADPPYNLDYLKSIHFQLFSDVYEWAGEFRQVDISKGDTRFCNFSRIDVEANKIFKQLQQQNYFYGLSKQDLIYKIADLYCELNIIHPFREGNGRTQRIFFEHLVAFCGYGIDWSKVPSQEEWINANIAGYHCNLNSLVRIFAECLIDQISTNTD
ncbi:putative adenosine monophosphate-protein transferase Fic [Acinetobacter sp.]|uniref:putative adenosine monophosphate-protein transferase Fic n=1 Tax=Acinetobacter sp. TaxID=472 RepID=UPI003D0205D0